MVAARLRSWSATRAPWALPTHEATEGLEVSTSYSGRPVRWPLGQSSLLIAGTSGSGKSVALRRLMASASARADVAMVAADLKGGVELAPWGPRLHCLATTQEDTRALLLLVASEVRGRLALLHRLGQTMWSADLGPYLLVILDELAEAVSPISTAREARALAADVLSLLVSVARIGRATGTHVVAATQRPDAETVSGAFRSQCDYRLGLRTRSPEESVMVDPSRAVDLTLLAGGGDAHWLPPLPFAPTSCRATYLEPASIPVLAARTAPIRPEVPRLAHLAWRP